MMLRVLAAATAFALSSGASTGGQFEPQIIGDTITPASTTFVKDVAAEGMKELQIARIAQEKAASAEVKEYARVLAADHARLNEQIQRYAATHGISVVNIVAGPEPPVLQGKNGGAFDSAFVQLMIINHDRKIRSFELHGALNIDPDLKTFVSAALPIFRQHLKRAADIQKLLPVTGE
jgi:putative membrane protein